MDVSADEWNAITDALIKVVVLAFMIERALAVIFDTDRVRDYLVRSGNDLKPWVAIAVSVTACYGLKINAVGPLGGPGAALGDGSYLAWLGTAITGLVVAGGSVGAVKLFQDVLGFRRSTREQAREAAALETAALKAEAGARLERAKADIELAKSNQVAAQARHAA